MNLRRPTASLIFVLVVSFVATSLFLSAGRSHEPRNLALCKQEVKAYVTSDQYMEDIQQVTNEAKRYIEEHLNPSLRTALVFDVDETSLSHLNYELSLDFGYSRRTWSEWVQKAEAPPILPTLELYKWARSKNLSVFFLSGTRENLRASVAASLMRAGYTSWDSLYLKPVDLHEPASVFKPRVRKGILGAGYHIIANIGDQESDLVGGYAEKTFKLPNPMYLVE